MNRRMVIVGIIVGLAFFGLCLLWQIPGPYGMVSW